MKTGKQHESIVIKTQHLQHRFFPTGDTHQMCSGEIMINGFIGNMVDGSCNNIWLRIYEETSILTYPLLGIQSHSSIKTSENAIIYYGEIENIEYTVTFFMVDNSWFFDVQLSGTKKIIDLVYGQDIGLANKGSIITNELYSAQYLGHSIFTTNNGYCICSRQNQEQKGTFPYIQQGMLKGKAEYFSTDALQFFTNEYKLTQVPQALSRNLDNRNLQYEGSYIALQSEKLQLHDTYEATFYGFFINHHPKAVESLEYQEEILNAYHNYVPTPFAHLPEIIKNYNMGSVYSSPTWNVENVTSYYKTIHLPEYENGKLLSFFTDTYSHVVLQEKEILTDRPHANIITTNIDKNKVNNHLITSTNYMGGIFNSHIVLGNTSFHKLISVNRGFLNILKNTGQRIYLKIDNQYQLLNLPAVFEVGVNYSKWIYEIGTDIVTITSFIPFDTQEVILQFESQSNINYDMIITNQLVLGDNEFEHDFDLVQKDNILRISPLDTNLGELHYDLQILGADYSISDDSIFFENSVSQNKSLLCLDLQATSSFQLNIRGSLEKDCMRLAESRDFLHSKKHYLEFYQQTLNHFHLSIEHDDIQDLEKLNATALWYTHNALVHYSVPHGLEQPGGAAWGTRDICQGPVELFLATQNYTLTKDILKNIFSHQSPTDGEWPQWFMFDNYRQNAGECHGDVVFWPLKTVADYINQSDDYTILNEVIPFVYASDTPACTLLEHLKLCIIAIKKRFLSGTHLISYAGGDWDDTLQPATESLKSNLVSSWTQALAYQVIFALSDVLSHKNSTSILGSELKDMAQNIKKSFDTHLIINGVIAGFVYKTEDGTFKPMLHPDDEITGIEYRLLPMTRSIIADLVSPKQAKKNMNLIEDVLHHPDGVRLMNKPAAYNGGVCNLFIRAEQAANVGREISLQYVHAHIRYIEAVAHLNSPDFAWKSLFEINPINIKDVVPNARLRQSNLYFSSSEGAFYDRYDYEENFEKLCNGSIDVKGGWRLYSSGPGIYLNQMISNILGLKFKGDNLLISPCLPKSLDNLNFTYKCYGKKLRFVYHINNQDYTSIIAKQTDAIILSITETNIYNKKCIAININSIDENAPIDIYLN